MSKRTNILITGAGGLLGARTVRALAPKHNVHAIVRSEPESPVGGVTYHKIDLASTEWKSESLPSDIDTVFHLAQSSKFRDFPDQAMDVFRVNVDSTARLLDYARAIKAKRFIYTSSGGVYGTGVHAFHENSPIGSHRNLGYYLGSKLCSEILVETYAQIMTVGILRPFFMYGKEQNRTMLIPRLVDSVKTGKPIVIQGEQGISINPVHVDDAVRVLEHMLDAEESCTLNIAGPDVLSIKEIGELIGRLTGKAPVFEQASGIPNNLVAKIDSMKIRDVAPRIHLSEGLIEIL